MATAKQTTFRFTPADHELLTLLQQDTGIVNQTDIIRMALRALAAERGVSVAPAPARGTNARRKARR